MRKIAGAVMAAGLFLALAQPVSPPPVKEGLWSVHMISVDNPGNRKTDFTSKLCRSHAYDEYAQSLAKNRPGCKMLHENLSGGVYSAESECNVAGTVIRTSAKTTLQGDTAFHSESHATYTPAFHGTTESTIVIEQAYLGSCPAGVQPGDRIAQDGTVTHTWRH